MQGLIRQLLLPATAMVALSASIAACGGLVASFAEPHGAPPPADGGDTSLDAGTAREASAPDAKGDRVDVAEATMSMDASAVPDAGDDAATCDAPPPGTDAGVSEETFMCCVSAVHAILGGDSTFVGTNQLLSAPATLACCNAIILRIDQDEAAMSPDFEADTSAGSGAPTGICCERMNPMPTGPACGLP
jgi:hypothetical protein